MHVEVAVGAQERLEANVRSHRIVMDQPAENNGEDAGPTPSEVFVASLAACTAHYLRVACRKHGIDPAGTNLSATAKMSSDAPKRIAGVEMTVHIPAGVPAAKRERILATAQACFVTRTLEHGCDIQLRLAEQDEAATT